VTPVVRVGLLALTVVVAFQAVSAGPALCASPALQYLDGASGPCSRSAAVTTTQGAVGSLPPHRLEHHIGFEELADVRLQLKSRQLQEPDRLLQLRGHRELLTQLQLQRRFQHGELRKARRRLSNFIP
jgi:hypothetical protein